MGREPAFDRRAMMSGLDVGAYLYAGRHLKTDLQVRRCVRACVRYSIVLCIFYGVTDFYGALRALRARFEFCSIPICAPGFYGVDSTVSTLTNLANPAVAAAAAPRPTDRQPRLRRGSRSMMTTHSLQLALVAG